jgi:hypothetical protein
MYLVHCAYLIARLVVLQVGRKRGASYGYSQRVGRCEANYQRGSEPGVGLGGGMGGTGSGRSAICMADTSVSV